MDLLSAALTLIGLGIFEIVTSIDNAVINAEVLSTMSKRARRWFLLWGLLFAVFAVRGLLPWLIVWAANPSLGPWGAFVSTLSSDPQVTHAIEESAPILLMGGGVFLIFVFLHWLFLEEKHCGLFHEPWIRRQGVWFYAVASVLLAVIVWYALKLHPLAAFGAVMGSTVFFITHGFKQNAEKAEQQMVRKEGGLSDLSKIFYLEVIDASFSIDGVLGAFAFTLSVPLILLGNGLGAVVLRQLTVSSIERVKRYCFLKNGAMYSIAVLGGIMIADAFGAHVPEWITPITTIAIIGCSLWRSVLVLRNHNSRLHVDMGPGDKPMTTRREQ